MRCRLSCIEQLIYIFTINVFSFRLPVRSIISAVAYPFVELDSQPFEGFDNVCFGSRHETLRVGVFDTEDHISVILLGKQIVIESGTNPANM